MSKRRADGDPDDVPDAKRTCGEAEAAPSVFALIEAERNGVGRDIMRRCMSFWLVESENLKHAVSALSLRATSTAWQQAWNAVFNHEILPSYQLRNNLFAASIQQWINNGCEGEEKILDFKYAHESALQLPSYLILCVNADLFTPPFLREMRTRTIRQIIQPFRGDTSDRRTRLYWENSLRAVHGDLISLLLLLHCRHLCLGEGTAKLLHTAVYPTYLFKIFNSIDTISILRSD